MLVHRKGALAAACTAALAALSFVPSASALTLGTLTQVPDLPFAGTSTACDNLIAASTAAGSHNYPDTEVEPMVAVDPTNPSHLVAAFQQDRWNDGGANGDVAVVSTSGGSSWTLSGTQAAFSTCEGGTLDRTSDPVVAFSSNGSTVYQSALAFNANGPAFGGTSSVQVSTSSDGSSWNTPAVVKEDTSTTVLNDKDWITADPRPSNPDDAYLVWDRLVSPSTKANPGAFVRSPAFKGPSWFSKTTDSGASWSTPKIIFDPGRNNQTIDNEIVVEPDGTLIDGFTLLLNKSQRGNPRSADLVAMIRSTDGGATWSGPTIISQLIDAPVSSLDGLPYRTGDILPQFTVDQSTGNVYVVWQDGRFANGTAKIAFSESTNGGTTWSTPLEIDGAPSRAAAFTPQIAVSSDGTIGVTYYDTEHANLLTAPAATDEYIVTCKPSTSVDCASANPFNWSAETPLDTTSFDMTSAPNAAGFFTGDYEGLTTSGTTFDPFFVMARPDATACINSTAPCTDPFANTATP